MGSKPERPALLAKLILCGATGDLAGRYLFPALAALSAAGKLPQGFTVVGAARHDWDDATFRRHAAGRLDEHASELPADARETVVSSLRYRRLDFDDPRSVDALVTGDDPCAVYLAVPSRVFPTAIDAFGSAGLPPGSRLVVEKPFGDDLHSAIALNRSIAQLCGPAGEQAVFRVDHILGMATVHNLIGLRNANPILDAIWSAAHIAQIELLWEETLGLEGRAGFFDHTGALKDVIQNHVFQLLCLVAMEPAANLERDLRDHKVDVLRAVRVTDPRTRTRRARYTAGQLFRDDGTLGARVPDYARENGVDPRRSTETFAELALELDSPRWSGTRFVIRAGKALRRRRKEIVVRFRPSRGPFGATFDALRIGIDGPETTTLSLTGAAGSPLAPAPMILGAPPPAAELPAYGRVLLDVLSGGSTLSVRGDEAEESWRALMPVLDAWARGKVPLEEYRAGSDQLPPTKRSDAIRAERAARSSR